MIKIAHPLIGEEEKKAVLEVLDSGMLVQGPRVQAFEESFARYCTVKHAIATSSGTAALHTILSVHGIGPGDEVITSAFTFVATANAIRYTGAKPVFVDIDPLTFNINPARIEEVITSKTKAILPVHLFGLSCDMEAIMAIASRHNLIVIEDGSQSHGALYDSRIVGSFGDGAFSLYATKNMTSAEGGMITTNSDEIVEKARAFRQHGMRRRYFHEGPGFNYCMSDVHAAIGLAQLNKLDGFNQARCRNAEYLSRHLTGVIIPSVPPKNKPVYHQYTIRVPNGRRDPLRTYLQARGIASEVYYPIPVHFQPFYTDYLDILPSLPQTELAAQEVLSLPVHPGLSLQDLELIANSVNSFMGEIPD
jgi:perosamine synthetase